MAGLFSYLTGPSSRQDRPQQRLSDRLPPSWPEPVSTPQLHTKANPHPLLYWEPGPLIHTLEATC